MTVSDNSDVPTKQLRGQIASSITAKVTLAVAAVFVGSASVFVFFASQSGTAMLERLATTKAEDLARICLLTVEEIMTHREQHLLDNVLGLSIRSGVVEEVLVIRDDGAVRTMSWHTPNTEGLPLRLFGRRESLEDTTLTVRRGDSLSLWLVRPVVRKPECRSCHTGDRPLIGHLAVKVSVDDLRPIANDHRFSNILLSSLAFLLLGGAVLATVLRVVVRPVNTLRGRVGKLIEQVQGLERGEPVESTPVQVRGTPDEISDLSKGFNKLVAELNETHARVREAHRKRMEEAYRLALVGERAARIVHDVRNPIMGVVGALQVMEGETVIDDQYRPIIREITVQLQRTSALLNDLLASARPHEAVIERVDLNTIVRSTLTVVSAPMRERKITVEQHLMPTLPPMDADLGLVQQLIWNILTNAIEAESTGGRVTVSTVWRESSDEIPGWESLEIGCAGLRVSDTGKGMWREDLAEVFEPYHTTRAEGVGLGLSIAKRIVELHGGSIAMDSAPGKGTTVTILLPLKRQGT